MVYPWCILLVFSNQGHKVEIFRQSSSSSRPGLDMTQDRSDVRFSEILGSNKVALNCNNSPWDRFFAMEGGGEELSSSTMGIYKL